MYSRRESRYSEGLSLFARRRKICIIAVSPALLCCTARPAPAKAAALSFLSLSFWPLNKAAEKGQAERETSQRGFPLVSSPRPMQGRGREKANNIHPHVIPRSLADGQDRRGNDHVHAGLHALRLRFRSPSALRGQQPFAEQGLDGGRVDAGRAM